MSRHPYDLVSMMETEIGQAALSDYALYDHLTTHRKWYTGYTYIDYEMLGHSTIQFVPPVDFIDLYRKDYETMQTEMIYGDTKSLDELLERLKMLQGKFRLKMDVKTLEEIIEEARKYIPDALQAYGGRRFLVSGRLRDTPSSPTLLLREKGEYITPLSFRENLSRYAEGAGRV